MASRLAFQTQLASIMEVLANAAVAEICKLVDDDYAVVSLQMSQCQRENKALKRKLHLMELKMARCFAERRLRDSSASIGRARVHVGGNDRFRSSSTTSGVVFEGQMDMGSWPGRAAPGAASTEPTTCDLQQDTSADVELVEAELVKQEKMEETEEEVQEEVQLIRADGQLERGPGCSQVQRSSRPQQEVQADYHHSECPDPVSASTRGVEKEEDTDVMRVKQEAGLETKDHAQPTLIIQEGLVESGKDDYKASLPLDAISQPAQECGRGFSETPADPQSKPSAEPCTAISVHTEGIDTNTSAKNSTSHQPRRPGSEAPVSECSVLDLEAFFTRWTPESGAPPAAPPSCSFSAEELLEDEEVVLVEKDQQPLRKIGGNSQRSSRIQTNHSPSPGTSLSASPRIQAPPPQVTWSRAAAMMRTTQTQSLQQAGHSNRTAHRVLHSAQNMLTTNAGLNDVSHRSGTQARRLPNFPSFSPAGLPTRGCEGKALSSDGLGLGGVSIGLDGVSIGHDNVSMGLGGVSMGLDGISGTLGGVSHSRLGGVGSGLGGVSIGLDGNMELNNVSPGLGGVGMGLGGDSGSLVGVSGGLGDVSGRLGGSRRRNYVCRACGKAFSGLSNLEAHQRVHTGEKPFSCSTCGKRFSEAGNLKKHQRVHTGDKPYGCHRCGKRFAWVCNLRTHQQTGAGCSTGLALGDLEQPPSDTQRPQDSDITSGTGEQAIMLLFKH